MFSSSGVVGENNFVLEDGLCVFSDGSEFEMEREFMYWSAGGRLGMGDMDGWPKKSSAFDDFVVEKGCQILYN